ncbi:MAG TPA: HD domain-containing phosphohydrolase [Candidatus Dormibacteraeota bacterium]|nr:HD domain-containing phosphohydrolase [Candidatus Dormibacteraeota bacterium]
MLVVDDSSANRELLEACLAELECGIVPAADGGAALERMEQRAPDVVLVDLQMPGIDGYELCRRIRANPRWRLIPVVVITGFTSRSERIRALESGADDFMSKPIDRLELTARVRSMLNLRAAYRSLEDADQVIFALAAAVEAKDPFMVRHTHRVGAAARHLGICLELEPHDLDALYLGGIIHDIGKIGVADAVLLKPGPLEPFEMARVQLHPLIGETIISPLRSAAALLPIVRHHHERIDGGGYPDGLAGPDIPELARIVAVCDAYDALVNNRPYRGGHSIGEAVSILESGAGTIWDAEFVELLVGEIPSIQLLDARCGTC